MMVYTGDVLPCMGLPSAVLCIRVRCHLTLSRQADALLQTS